MQLSTKGRYAVMAMADLAHYSGDGVVSLAEIAERQQLSLAYLEQLFQKLRKSNLVESIRGPGGGYRLAATPHDIRVATILDAVEEPVKMTRCHLENSAGCVKDSRCLTHDLWSALGDHIYSFLDGVTLGDIVDNARAKDMCQPREQMVAGE